MIRLNNASRDYLGSANYVKNILFWNNSVRDPAGRGIADPTIAAPDPDFAELIMPEFCMRPMVQIGNRG